MYRPMRVCECILVWFVSMSAFVFGLVEHCTVGVHKTTTVVLLIFIETFQSVYLTLWEADELYEIALNCTGVAVFMPTSCFCAQMRSLHTYSWKYVPVFAWMQKLFWPVNLHLSLSLSSLQACRHWSMKASTASLLIEDASRLFWCPAGTAAADRRKREGTEDDIELITTTAVTNSRSGEHVGPSESLHHLL